MLNAGTAAGPGLGPGPGPGSGAGTSGSHSQLNAAVAALTAAQSQSPSKAGPARYDASPSRLALPRVDANGTPSTGLGGRLAGATPAAAKSVFPQRGGGPRSASLEQEVKLREALALAPTAPHPDRLRAVLRTLDAVIPQVPVWQNLLTLIRDELMPCLISNQVTSSGSTTALIERQPWFTLVENYSAYQKNHSQQAVDTIEELQQKLKFRAHDNQILEKRIVQLQQEIGACRKQVDELKHRETVAIATIRQHETLRDEMLSTQAITADTHKAETARMQAMLETANHVIAKLTAFQNTATEEEAVEDYEQMLQNRQELVIDAEGMNHFDLYQIERLQEQFAAVLNLQLDDYDTQVANIRKKSTLLTDVDAAANVASELDKEIKDIKSNYLKRVRDLLEEEENLRKHKKSLVLNLTEMQTAREQGPTMRRRGTVTMQKYAAIMLCSTDRGQTFQPAPFIAFCKSCCDRVVVCPHRATSRTAYALPPHVSHIRFECPSASVALVSRALADRGNNFDHQVFAQDEPPNRPTEDELTTTSEMCKRLFRFFYEQYKGYMPKYPRRFTLSRVIMGIDHQLDAQWAAEEPKLRGDSELTLVPYAPHVYAYFEDMYAIPSVATKAIHDFLSALMEFETHDVFINLILRHMVGETDSVWRYRRLIAKHVSAFEKFTIAQYRTAVEVLYPNRSKEALAQIEQETLAFTHGRMSAELFMSHLTHTLNTGVESNVQLWLRLLEKQDLAGRGTMPYEDYEDALIAIVPTAPAMATRALYKLAERDYKPDEVPLFRLAESSAFLYLFLTYTNDWVPPLMQRVVDEGPNAGILNKANGGVRVAPGKKLQMEVEHLLSGSPTDFGMTAIDEATLEQESAALRAKFERMQMQIPEEETDD
ncbi:hypothetical protein CXG81DRAFT_12569 [Caulochytrium protostelioides]|uniref:Uncharacterized protein n=1 Tax=Caulochytrium protostelioides TaxID=1555241 RepID=A0A4V1IUL5_9FUNG|nr:hypothetical protein CXG81DRAFT_12569 [Caulochytrium protostelioides]|eukprot:RKP00979.1 hypothetical protein CXG81DRAFT_12569 [Caulochytrium protostelioides]